MIFFKKVQYLLLCVIVSSCTTANNNNSEPTNKYDSSMEHNSEVEPDSSKYSKPKYKMVNLKSNKDKKVRKLLNISDADLIIVITKNEAKLYVDSAIKKTKKELSNGKLQKFNKKVKYEFISYIIDNGSNKQALSINSGCILMPDPPGHEIWVPIGCP